MKHTLLAFFHSPVKVLVLAAIRGYQVVISPGLPGRCKYYPSCSQYTLEAVRDYGAARGLIIGAWRILRCNPLSYGGYDPVSRQRLFASRCSRGSDAHSHEAVPDPPALGKRHSRRSLAGTR